MASTYPDRKEVIKLDNRIIIVKQIDALVGALTDPIIVFPGGWADTLPDWLKTSITLERLAMNMKALKGEEMIGTDAEACAYLYTASLTAPMDSDWTQIYLYIANQVYSRHRTKESGVEMPDDVRVDSLDNYRMGLLKELKGWIYRKRVKAREERGRAETRKVREEAAARAPKQLKLGV